MCIVVCVGYRAIYIYTYIGEGIVWAAGNDVGGQNQHERELTSRNYVSERYACGICLAWFVVAKDEDDEEKGTEKS